MTHSLQTMTHNPSRLTPTLTLENTLPLGRIKDGLSRLIIITKKDLSNSIGVSVCMSLANTLNPLNP